MRSVFAGSPQAAVPSLRALVTSGHEVALVVTREDSAQGRRRTLTATPVARAAEELGLPVLKTNRLAGAAQKAIAAARPDLGVIVAYGGLVRDPLLSMPPLGWVNLHFSLLPRWRGAAPVQHAIIAGDDLTGATVFRLVEELDAGDVYGQYTQPIGPGQTAGELLEDLSAGGAELLRGVVQAIARGEADARPQSGDVTLAPKLTSADGAIDLGARAVDIVNRIRGVTPEPGAFVVVDGDRLKVHRAAVSRDAEPLPPGRLALAGGRLLAGSATEPVELISVQPPGKRAMPGADWWRGRRAGAVGE